MDNKLEKFNKEFKSVNLAAFIAKAAAVGVCWTFFAYEVFKVLNCGSSYFMCGSFSEFSAVFLLYLLFIFFSSHISLAGYVALYIGSGILYSLIFLYIINWIQAVFSHWRNRPIIKIKRIYQKVGAAGATPYNFSPPAAGRILRGSLEPRNYFIGGHERI